MFFQKKLKRVLTNQKKAEERFAKEREELPLEKNDRLYDRDGILEIEKARTRYSFERKDRKPPRPSKDFGVIDREMLIRMLRDAALVKAEGKNV